MLRFLRVVAWVLNMVPYLLQRVPESGFIGYIRAYKGSPFEGPY